MESCRIEAYYVMRSEPHRKYRDSFLLHVDGEYKHDGPNTWTGSYGKYKVTVFQPHHHHEVSEEDVQFEPNPFYKDDPEISYSVLSKQAIAAAVNEHLNQIFD